MQKVPHFNSRTQAPGQGTRVYSDLAPPGGVWLCLEDPFIPFPFFLHTLAKQRGGAEPLGFSFLLENMQSWSICLSGLFGTRSYSFPESELSPIF